VAREINPKDFIAWLSTQRNANGTLYLERVARHYARYLKTAPPKLDIPLTVEEREVFTCTTTAKFDELRNAFLAAPNYKTVNENGHQSFSSGLKAYRRYLESLEQQGKYIKKEEHLKMGTVTTASAEQVNIAVRRVDFNHTELCTDCNPVSCMVNGEKLPVGTWRDLLMALITKFTAETPEKINGLYNRPLLTGSSRPFFLKDKPNGAARQTATGHWVYVNLNISTLADLIGKLCQYCGVSLDNVEITYTPKLNRGNSDIQRERNASSFVYTEQTIRAGFRAWIVKQHPDWSYNTVTMHISDAYYLYNNDRGITLAEALNADDGEQRAFAAIERYFTDNPTQTNRSSVSADGYLRSLQMLKAFLTEQYPELLKGDVAPANATVPESILTALTENYINGFRFDTTAIRLLSEKAQAEIDGKIQSKLKRLMFRRNDDVYFLPDMVCDAETCMEITDFANNWLDDYGCFEISELYDLFATNLNSRCIDSLEHFQAFYEFINRRDVRCVEYYRTRIARINRSVKDLSIDIATQIISIAREEFGGTINEDDLCDRFTAFSVNLLANIIKEHAEELVKTEINGMLCYQTLDALGLSDEFSDTLAEVLEQISDLELTPSEEVLHTALSINLDVNFKAEYNIPDDKTYRKLIETYYKNAPKRKWLKGIFAEVPD
jgi:hypothetical protein